MKIKKIVANNFQSHKHSEVELHPLFNVFVGETDQGKTSIAKRTILWTLFNKPQGDIIVREENGQKAKTCNVLLVIEDSNGKEVKIERVKERNKNRYVIRTEVGKQIYENFGTEVPEEIRNITQVEEVQIDEEGSINIHIIGARDKSYISMSNFFKTKLLSRLANTTLIDVAIDELEGEKKSISQKIRNCQSNLENINNQIQSLNKYPLLYQKILEIKKQQEIIDRLQQQKNTYVNYLSKLYKIKNDISDLQSLLNKLVNIEYVYLVFDKLSQKRAEIETIKNRIATYKRLNEKMNNYRKEIKMVNQELTQIKNIDIVILKEHLINGMVEKHKETMQKAKEIKKLYEKMIDIKNRIEKGRQYLKEVEVEKEILVGEYIDKLKSIKKCPVCMSNIEEKTIEKIEKTI